MMKKYAQYLKKKNYEGQCPRGGVNVGKVEFCDTHPISFIWTEVFLWKTGVISWDSLCIVRIAIFSLLLVVESWEIFYVQFVN